MARSLGKQPSGQLSDDKSGQAQNGILFAFVLVFIEMVKLRDVIAEYQKADHHTSLLIVQDERAPHRRITRSHQLSGASW